MDAKAAKKAALEADFHRACKHIDAVVGRGGMNTALPEETHEVTMQRLRELGYVVNKPEHIRHARVSWS